MIFSIIAILIHSTSGLNDSLYEGDRCVLEKNDVSGICTIVKNCEYALQMIKKSESPQLCGFQGKDPVVCCPQLQKIGSGPRKSVSKCWEYQDIRKQVYAIALGENALPREFPHMAAVGYSDENGATIWLCGASLISDRFVLTAAHCANAQTFGPPKIVRLGDLDLKNETEDANSTDIEIEEIIVHPEYKPPQHYNDIALLKLKDEVFFGIFSRPACLHNERALPNGSNLTATGWGKTSYVGAASSHLLKVTVAVINHEACAEKYSNAPNRKLPQGIEEKSQICAGDKDGRDTCPGDSGGPLQLKKDATEKLQRHFVIVGITSFGKACGLADTAGVYTRVSAYLQWIEDIVWP